MVTTVVSILVERFQCCGRIYLSIGTVLAYEVGLMTRRYSRSVIGREVIPTEQRSPSDSELEG